MQKLSFRKQLTIVRLYLSGFSYDEIAAQAGVSKGTVANVITELKAGRILNVHEPAEQLELLRELAVDLRRLQLNPGQAVAGLAAFSHLQELGMEPGDVERWATMCRELAPQRTEAQVFVRAALALKELRERTGLSAQALEEKASSLEKEVARLGPLAQKLKGCQQELEQLEKRRQSLSDEVSRIEKRLQPLRKDVTNKERRETELSHRVEELEQRAQAADERLAATRRELQALAGLGLSWKIYGFVQRVSGVAQRHGLETWSSAGPAPAGTRRTGSRLGAGVPREHKAKRAERHRAGYCQSSAAAPGARLGTTTATSAADKPACSYYRRTGTYSQGDASRCADCQRHCDQATARPAKCHG